jgi:hypothetical protein
VINERQHEDDKEEQGFGVSKLVGHFWKNRVSGKNRSRIFQFLTRSAGVASVCLSVILLFFIGLVIIPL